MISRYHFAISRLRLQSGAHLDEPSPWFAGAITTQPRFPALAPYYFRGTRNLARKDVLDLLIILFAALVASNERLSGDVVKVGYITHLGYCSPKRHPIGYTISILRALGFKIRNKCCWVMVSSKIFGSIRRGRMHPQLMLNN
jgi:hypothetical protein